MSTGRRTVSAYGWLAIVFVLFNSCAGHRETWKTVAWLGGGDWTPGIVSAARGIRAACNDDGDVNRYLAYANALLGRPYQAYYVRRIDAWKAEPQDDGTDYNDPSVVRPVRPPGRLVPYRDFSVEYPPGFFPFAVLPALFTSDMDAYRVLFSISMGLLLTLALALCVRIAERVLPPRRAAALVPNSAWAALAAGVILVRRYDATVSLSLCMVVWGCLFRKPIVAGLGLGLGIAAKGVPILVAPLALAFWLTRRRRSEAAVAGVTAMGILLSLAGPFVFAARSHAFDLFAYHAERPLEIESTGGALLLLARFVAPGGVTLSRAYGSSNAISTWDGLVGTTSGALLVVALVCVGIWAVFRMRREADDLAATTLLVRASCAALVAWMVFGKVLSPQYLTWLVPLGALASLVEGGSTEKLFLGALVLTQIIYPFVFKIAGSGTLSPWFGALVLVRNGLFGAWGISLLREGRTRASLLLMA
jgi:hypothetical protein